MTLNYLLWAFLTPGAIAIWLALLGTALLLTRKAGWAKRILLVDALLWLAIAVAPTGDWFMRPLETRFTAPDNVSDATAIVVLSGAEQLAMPAGLAGEYRDGAERMLTGIALARRLPGARLYLVGGLQNQDGVRDIDIMRHTALAMGVPDHQLVLVSDSRNTFENALMVSRRLRADGRTRPLLVTSAYHLPRAVLCFEAIGTPVIPLPVDYRTRPDTDGKRMLSFNPGRNLALVDSAAHEWLGLVVYRLTGKTLRLWPSAG